MMQKRRIRPFRKSLAIEALEDRMLLSGIVYAGEDLSTGMLSVLGDGGNNAISIKAMSSGVLRISGGVSLPGPSFRPDVTSVDGVTFRDYFLDTITGINIQMPTGNNTVAMAGFSIPGNITINAGSGQSTFSLDSIQTDVGTIGITATGLAADSITLNNVVAGQATLTTGAGANKISLNNVAIGGVNINTGTSTANNSITVSNSLGDTFRPGIGQLTVQTGNGNNTIGVTNTSLLNVFLTAGNGNNTISLDGSTLLAARITAGMGSNTVDVSNDAIEGFAGLNLNVGVGGNTVQAVQLINDTFSGGLLKVAVGDGSPLTASSFTMSNDVGIGTATLTLGKYFGNVTVGSDMGTNSVSANALTLSVGDGADAVQVHTSVGLDENLTVGNPATPPLASLPSPSITVDGFVGTSGFAHDLQVQVGDGWLVTVHSTATGNVLIHAGNADTISVTSPNVGGALAILVGDNSPSIAVTGTTSNDLTIQAGNGDTYFYLSSDTVNNALNLATGDGDSALALLNVNVLFSLFVTFGTGAHILAAQNTTCLFGQIDAGPGSSNIYEDLGVNFGFFVTGVTGIVAGPFPPIFDASDLSLSARTVNQGDTLTLTGTFSQLGIDDMHTVTINWGDGSEDTVLLDSGTFTFSATHQYFDDNPDGTRAVVENIGVTVTNSIGDSASASTPVTVKDVAPVILPDGLQLRASTINEGGSVDLTGAFANPSSQDTHQVLINWGDGSAPTTLALGAGVQAFGPIHHTYQQNLPGNAPYTIQVTVSDEDNASVTASTQVTVANVAPSDINLGLTNATLNEGDTTTLNGTFTDPGVLDTHTVVINWGDGSPNTTLSLAAGTITFGADHQYQQNLPSDAPYTIQATVSDEDNASSTASTPVTVSNVAPANLNLTFANAAINEGDSATLNGTFTDPGVLDTHTVVINWGDGSANSTLSLDAGVVHFNANHNYIDNLPGNAPYTIQVAVSDDDNASTSASTPLIVNNVAPANLRFATAPINEGDSATLNGTFTDPGVLDTHTVVINWGDGSANTTLSLGAGVLSYSANHPYVDNLPGNAPYSVQVTITDQDNATSSASTPVTVNNVPPANINLSFASTPVNEGDTATLTGTFTDPGVLDTHMVVISWGDGSLDTTLDLGANLLSFQANHRYQKGLPGNAPYTVQATVVDNDKASGSGSTQITVNNVLPTNLKLGLASDTLNEGDTATLNGTFTDPGVLNTHTVVINWGDGTASTTLSLGAGVLNFSANHPYQDVQPGNAPFTIQVTVTNQDNANTSATTPVTVNNVPPANIDLHFANASVNEGDTATLNGTFTDPAIRDTHTVVVNWGDGSPHTTVSLDANVLQFSAQHAYLNSLPGNAPYSIQVTISDEDNATASATTTLLVNNVAPTVNAGPDQILAEGTPVTLNGTFTDPGAGDGHTMQWTVASSNGQVISAGNGSSFTFTPNDDGKYTATLTVTDSDGGVGTSKVTVTATRVPPTLMISGVASVNKGSPYTLSLSGKEVGIDTISSWTITWGDGAVQTVTGNPSSATHVYANPNSYTVSARATDEDGTFDAANTVAVQVVDGQPTLTLSGAATGNPLSPYTLNLSSSDAGTSTITSWTINWGDGTTQPVSGNPSSVTHTYPLVHRSYTISAQVTSGNGTIAAGNTVTVNLAFATPNQDFVAQVYLDVLNRPVDQGGLQSWTDQLSAGVSRGQVVQGIMNSQEYRTDVVEQLYQSYLGRTADASGLNNDLVAMAGGATTDQIKAGILGSDEYNQRAGGTSNGFISALYHDLLGRTGTPSEMQGWIQAESAGVARTKLASLFIGSTEANQLLVQNFYHQYLHRSADQDGLNAFVQSRANGATEEAVIAALVASDEYFQQAAR